MRLDVAVCLRVGITAVQSADGTPPASPLTLVPLKPLVLPPEIRSPVPLLLRLLRRALFRVLLVSEMVIAGALDYSLVRAGAASVAYEKLPAACGTETTATEPPLPPFPKLAKEAAGSLPRPEPSPREGGHPVPAPSASLPDAPTAPPAPPAAAVERSAPAAGLDPAPPASSAPDAAQSAPVVPAALPAALVPPAAIPAVVQSPLAVSATTGGPAPSVAPSAAGQSAPAVTPMAPAGQPSRPPSPDHRLSRPHSPALHQERKSSRHHRDSPRRYQQPPHWPAHPGGHGDWRGPRGRGRGGYRPPVTMADLQREVSRAAREKRAAQSQSSSMRASPAHEAPRQPMLPLSPPPVAAPPPQNHRPTVPAPAVSAPAPGSRLQLPPVPPVAGVEFVAAGGGAAAAQYSHQVAADAPLLFLAEALQPPHTRVPEATLGQLHRLAESLHALLLIQVVAHSSLPVIPVETFRDRPRETCLDAADQLTVLLAPVLAEPAEGGAAAAGQLDEAVRGLRRHLRAGSGAAAIGASTLVVRELWRTLTGVLHALGAHRM
ncbi:unnamed protein product [Closterium sp. Naga37s-1]|nr:unnamed protein product [Closterium sp. Naga37s-1]